MIIRASPSNPIDMHNTQTYEDDGEIDLRQLVSTLWQQKGLIAGIGVLGAALGVGGSLLSTKYVTEGLLLTPSVSATDYKRYESVLSSGARLEEFLRLAAQTDSNDGQRLQKLADKPTGLQEAIKPEFALTDKDQKAFGIKADGDAQNALVGLRIRYADKDPSNGTPLALLAEYVRDSLIKIDLAGATLTNCNTHATRAQELRNQQIQNEFTINQEEKRIAGLREIIARHPNAGTAESRQIVSLGNGTERFLSPVAQLVAAEIHVADLKLTEAQRERDRTASELKRKYYCDAEAALRQPVSGRKLLGELQNIQTSAFQSHDRTTDIVEQTWNELELERERWHNTYLTGMRFVAPPEGTEVRERKPGRALGIALGGLLGATLAVFGVLVRAWWSSTANATSTKP